MPTFERKFIIVSGYCPPECCTVPPAPGFFATWLENTRKAAPLAPIYIISSAIERPATNEVYWYVNGEEHCLLHPPVQWIEVENLGHAHRIPKEQQLCGWSACFVTGLLLAYQNNADLVLKESDALAFGPWIDRLYSEIGDKGVITGHPNGPGPAVGLLAQSLVLVRYRYLLEFASRFLAIKGSDGQPATEAERKFERMARETGEFAQASFGYDRTRPVNYNDEVFYMQQITAEEMAELKRRGLA
jgi:hypothetical protein